MTILLIRHAHAINKGTLADEERWLSHVGRKVARIAGSRLRDAGILPDVVVASPLVRTIQTAELVAAGLGWDGTIEVLPALAPSGSPRVVADELRSMGGVVAAGWGTSRGCPRSPRSSPSNAHSTLFTRGRSS